MRHLTSPTMDGIHTMDVSWLHHAKDHHGPTRAPNASPPPANGNGSTTSKPSKTPQVTEKAISNGNDTEKGTPTSTTSPKPIPGGPRPGVNRTNSADKMTTANSCSPKNGSTPNSPSSITRRNSWLSSLSSKFSSQQNVAQGTSPSTPPAKESQTQDPYMQRPPGPGAPKNAILPHASRADGDAPYVPAPPRTSHPNFITSALRRLSSSGGQLQAQAYRAQHGLCERKILNVDERRDRCRIAELNQVKLRRVAFCVDVEIAAAPHYKDDDTAAPKKDQVKKKKIAEKSEGEALKNPETVKIEKETEGVVKATGEKLPKEPEKEGTDGSPPATSIEVKPDAPPEKEMTRKKEKKKRSEEERKARKEKRRRQAEANGTVPVEHMIDLSDSSGESSSPGTGTGTSKSLQALPTIDPVRIYRRCCQLRETPILRKITEQLSVASNTVPGKPGYVNKLDLTDYALNLSDLTTLGDYLAVVPIKELILENCNLTDEGVRIVLSGLLDSKPPQISRRRKPAHGAQEPEFQGGVVERLVLKNNTKIGREGWKFICAFIHMSRSLRFIDLSMIPFPQPLSQSTDGSNSPKGDLCASARPELHCTFAKAIAERLAGPVLELINLAATGLTTEQIGIIIDGVNKLGLRRLGLAGNNLNAEGVEHVARFLRQGICEGLDLGSNDLNESLGVIANALSENQAHPIWALSLANCSLTPDALWKLIPALAKLKNLRFIDLSHNHGIFSIHPSALSLLRRYLPKMPILKRIHLTDVAMSPEQAIGLAEILPECPELAHINLLENPELTALSVAKDEANQEEACAFYASMMAAVRVSKSIVCVDLDIPTADSSEVVRALAKQVVAYCLRNIQRGPVAAVAEIDEAALSLSEFQGPDNYVPVPDVLLHLVGHDDDFPESHDDDEPAPDQDYVIGSQGVVKALDICLKRRNTDLTRPTPERYLSGLSDQDGTATPIEGAKAKNMSKNLLDSARKIRARLQPALLRAGDEANYNRLTFLDNTLQRMIQRFEDEYPETRLPAGDAQSIPSVNISNVSPSGSFVEHDHVHDASCLDTAENHEQACVDAGGSDDEAGGIRPVLSRHNSDVSLASRALSQEEGRMHRFGQQFRRDILKPENDEQHMDTATGDEQEPAHLQLLRAMVEESTGEDLKRKVEAGGDESLVSELSLGASALRQKLMAVDPEGWERFKQSQEAAQRNSTVTSASP